MENGKIAPGEILPDNTDLNPISALKYDDPNALIIAASLLEALAGNIDTARDLKAMASNSHDNMHAGIVLAKKLGLVPGVNVILTHSKNANGKVRKGLITEFREKVGGLYCGIRYPVQVALFEEGHVFEYSLDDLVICNDYTVFDKFKSEDMSLAIKAYKGDVFEIYAVDPYLQGSVIPSDKFFELYNHSNLYEKI